MRVPDRNAGEKLFVTGKSCGTFTVMLLFYCLGSVIRLLLDRFDRQNEEKANRSRKKEKALQEEEALWVTGGHSAEGCKRFEWMKPVRKGY